MARSTLHAERRCVTAQPFPPLNVPTGLLGGFSHAIMSVGFLPGCRCSVFPLVGSSRYSLSRPLTKPTWRAECACSGPLCAQLRQASGLKARGSKVGRVKAKTVKTLGNMQPLPDPHFKILAATWSPRQTHVVGLKGAWHCTTARIVRARTSFGPSENCLTAATPLACAATGTNRSFSLSLKEIGPPPSI